MTKRIDTRLWNLVFPTLLLAGCANDADGDSTETSEGQDDTHGTSHDAGSADAGMDDSGMPDVPDPDAYCLDPYSGADICEQGSVCDVDTGLCQAIPMIPDCAEAFSGRTDELPVGGVLQIEHTTDGDRLWIGERNGHVRRIDDPAAGSGGIPTQVILDGQVLYMHFVDVRGDGAEELVVGQRPTSLAALGYRTDVFDVAGGMLSNQTQLVDKGATGAWVIDSDGDGQDELVMTLADGSGYDGVYWAQLDPKPWSLPIPVENAWAAGWNATELALDPSSGDDVLVMETACYGECGPTGDTLLGQRDDGIFGHRGYVDRWPAYRRLRAGLPMNSGWDVVGFAHGLYGGVAFAQMTGDETSSGEARWPDEARWFPGLVALDAQAIDYDGDGVADLAAITEDGVAIMLRPDEGLDGCVLRLALDETMRELAVGDLDGDGRNDLIVSSGVANDGQARTTTIIYGE